MKNKLPRKKTFVESFLCMKELLRWKLYVEQMFYKLWVRRFESKCIVQLRPAALWACRLWITVTYGCHSAGNILRQAEKINNNRLLGEILVRKGTVASSLSVCLSVSRWIKVGGYTSKPWTTVTHNYRRIIMVVIISYYGSWEAEKSKSRDQTDRLGPEAMCLISTSICRPKCRSPPV